MSQRMRNQHEDPARTERATSPDSAASTDAALRTDVARPLHAQVSDLIRARIDAGVWPPHYKLRAEPELAAEFGVSRGTLRRALQTLLDEGRLARTHGRGTFVTASEPEPAIAQEMLSLSEALARQGLSVQTDVLATDVSPPPDRVGALLDLAGEMPTFRLTRRYLVQDQPIAYLVNHVRLDICDGIDRIDFVHKRLFDVLEGEYGLTLASGRRTFAAVGATATVAAALEVTPGSPVLYLEQVTYLHDGTPLEYSDVWIRGDRLRLSALLTRERGVEHA